MSNKTDENYWEEIESLAKNIVEESDSEDEMQDRITETVDGHTYIVHYRHNEFVLDNTKNEPRFGDLLIDKNALWRDVMQVAASHAMQIDLYEKCRELWKEKQEALEAKEEEVSYYETLEENELLTLEVLNKNDINQFDKLFPNTKAWLLARICFNQIKNFEKIQNPSEDQLFQLELLKEQYDYWLNLYEENS